MNLDELFESQRRLDEHIIKEKGLEGQELFNSTMLALHVEIGEMINNWRGFKYWSNNQEPRLEVKCHACGGSGEFNIQEGTTEFCTYCDATGIERKPLLEEYADCLHFFLSIAIKKGWEDIMYLPEDAIWDAQEDGLDGGITGVILEMLYHLSRTLEKSKDYRIAGCQTDQHHFKTAWFLFILLGLVGFNFTEEQIEKAYKEKNKVNHQRQVTGY